MNEYDEYFDKIRDLVEAETDTDNIIQEVERSYFGKERGRQQVLNDIFQIQQEENEKKYEAIIEPAGSPILAKNQNPYKMANPNKVFALDEQGNFVKTKILSEEMQISQFWAKQQKKIALLLIVSAFIPLSILIQETDLLNLIFGNIFNLIASFFGFVFEGIF